MSLTPPKYWQQDQSRNLKTFEQALESSPRSLGRTFFTGGFCSNWPVTILGSTALKISSKTSDQHSDATVYFI
ncbi:8242_t:CDS:2 [Funneliformis mosseae]|uniref:8242_t:CDS:1 n=1 Tax=Funneliformis mosseae TaxID=27381 RepID=A0A9N9B141_FUNMO|nr:8242_t:CDS:2 [Funneliformis mosseae]